MMSVSSLARQQQQRSKKRSGAGKHPRLLLLRKMKWPELAVTNY